MTVTTSESECVLPGAKARPAVDDCGTLGTVSKSLQRHTCYKKRIVRVRVRVIKKGLFVLVKVVLLSLWINFQTRFPENMSCGIWHGMDTILLSSTFRERRGRGEEEDAIAKGVVPVATTR